jgi:hypothetical protein
MPIILHYSYHLDWVYLIVFLSLSEAVGGGGGVVA